MGIATTTMQGSMKRVLISLAILAFAAAAHAQDEATNTDDLLNEIDVDEAQAADASASSSLRLYAGKECANTHKWHIEEDCQSARGHCWVRVADFSSKFGTCRKFCAAQARAASTGKRRRKSGARTPVTLMASLPGATSHVTTPVVTQVMLSADAPLISLTNPWF